MWRYCRRGVRGIRLEHIWSGRAILTSREAVLRFIRATNEAAKQEIVGGFAPAVSAPKRHPRSVKQRGREHEDARRRLAAERI
jgi:hypothetical protein